MEGLFPVSPEPLAGPQAPGPQLLSPPAKSQLLGVKGMLSNLWYFSARNKHFQIPFRPPEPGTLPTPEPGVFLRRHLGALGDFSMFVFCSCWRDWRTPLQ